MRRFNYINSRTTKNKNISKKNNIVDNDDCKEKKTENTIFKNNITECGKEKKDNLLNEKYNYTYEQYRNRNNKSFNTLSFNNHYLNSTNTNKLLPNYSKNNSTFSQQGAVLQTNRINRIKYQEILKSQSVSRKKDILRGFNSSNSENTENSVNAVNGELPVSLYRTTFPENKKFINQSLKNKKCNQHFTVVPPPTIIDISCCLNDNKCVDIVITQKLDICYSILGYRIEVSTTDKDESTAPSGNYEIIHNTNNSNLNIQLKHAKLIGNAKHWFKISAITETGISKPSNIYGVFKDITKPSVPILLNNTYIKGKQDSNDYQEPRDIYINLPKLYSNEIDIYFFIPDYTLNKLYPNNRDEINVLDYRGDVSGCIYYEIYDSHDTVVSGGNKNFKIDNSLPPTSSF